MLQPDRIKADSNSPLLDGTFTEKQPARTDLIEGNGSNSDFILSMIDERQSFIFRSSTLIPMVF
jgi:hypothetical protein